MIASEDLILCQKVTKSYGEICALDGLSMSVRAGEVFCFLGENGASKTTLIRLIVGLQKPDAGQIRVFGEELSTNREAILARIGSLIEFPSFYPHLNGLRNLEIIRILRSLPHSEVDRVLDIVGLRDAARRKAGEYSQGMQQRLAIATALLGQPDLIILDEPTNGLDPVGIREIRSLIQSLPESTGATVFVSSHMLSEVEQMADRVAIIQKGGLLFQGTLSELAEREPPQLLIRTSQPERASRFLRELGVEVAVQNGERIVAFCPEQDIPRLNRLLVEENIPVLELSRIRRSLEHLYFNLTGGTSACARPAVFPATYVSTCVLKLRSCAVFGATPFPLW